MDALQFLDELRRLLLDGADQLMATAYTTGTGTGQPTGIVTALAGTASEINTAGSEALVAADAFTLQNALPPRFQPVPSGAPTSPPSTRCGSSRPRTAR